MKRSPQPVPSSIQDVPRTAPLPKPATAVAPHKHAPAIALIVLVLAALALYWQTAASLLHLWTVHGGATYQHGLLVVGMCVYFFYRRWLETGGALRVRPSSSVAALVLVVSLAWALAGLVDVLIVQQVSLVLLLCLLVASVVGYRSAWLFAIPLGLLIFVVPVWEPLNPYLQRLFANVVTVLLNVTGIPALLQGTEISVPAGAFDVKPGCSGLGQIMVGAMTGALFGYINKLKGGTTAWLVAAGVAVAVITNTLRIYVTVVIGQVSGMQHYLVTDHWAPGWVLFGIGMLIFFLAADRLTAAGGATSGTPNSRAASTDLAGGAPAGLTRSVLLSLAALALGPVLVHAYQPDQGKLDGLALILPAEIGGWRAAPAPASYRPVFHGPDFEHQMLYRQARDVPVYLYIAGYVHQEQGKEAVYIGNSVYDEGGWRGVSARTRRLGSGPAVKETRIVSRTGAERLVWQWYYVHGAAVSSGSMAKLLNAWGKLNGDPAIAVLIVATDIEGSDERAEAEGRLERFITNTQRTVERAIAQARRP